MIIFILKFKSNFLKKEIKLLNFTLYPVLSIANNNFP